ncbi:phosphatase PAP2 family protein [Cellulomonas septica]|uniref:Phosphatase PAP2 family protein n=1 Tax=Cellulomonas septica TaxID=285080 RepID=A0ABX1K2C3_9CELL|nr:phosphatase PAP2 family protein [Cellulomonas septica]
MPAATEQPGRSTRRPRAAVELLVVLGAFAAFTWVHAHVARDVAAATAHALTLQDAERTLGIDVALAANRWLVAQPTWVAVAAVYVYRSYYLVLLGVLVWVFVRHPEVYLRARRTLLAMMLLVLPVYWAVPMSPPRFALAGVVDVVRRHDPLGDRSAPTPGSSYTAMPSMHVGFSAWCAYAVWLALRTSHPRAAWAAWLFPLVMTGVVLTTGNHYVLDVVGTAVLLAASIGAATLWGRAVERRRRPRERVDAPGHDDGGDIPATLNV